MCGNSLAPDRADLLLDPPDLLTDWKAPSTLLELGGPVTVLPHGYQHVGQVLVWHYELDEVLESARIGRTLRNTPKAP